MKLSEFKKIMPHLPDDIEITIGEVPSPRKSTLKAEHWGNHDGRYNMKCIVCGWTSNDIRRDDYGPEFCPKGRYRLCSVSINGKLYQIKTIIMHLGERMNK